MHDNNTDVDDNYDDDDEDEEDHVGIDGKEDDDK